jgi:hypothetical protein
MCACGQGWSLQFPNRLGCGERRLDLRHDAVGSDLSNDITVAVSQA